MQMIGIQTGSNSYKLQHLVPDDKGKIIAKTSEIVLWIVCSDRQRTIYFPISKIDLEANPTIVPSQLYSSMNDRTRTLIKVTDNGNSIIPSGVLIATRH